MIRYTCLLLIATLFGACASTNTGNLATDKANRAANRETATTIGRGLARFLDNYPEPQSLEQTFFPLPGDK